MTVERELKPWKKSWWLRENSVVPINVSSLNLSLFLGFPLYSNVDSDRFWFVAQNWRIPPQNDSLLEELSSWIEKSFFPCEMTWFAPQCWSFAQTLGSFVYSSAHLCLSSTVPLRPHWEVYSFSHFASLYLLQSKTQLQKAFSLHAGALSLWHSPPQ